ncbi:MAG: hypothetical protein DIU73_000895 [Actinomycetes bacterium]
MVDSSDGSPEIYDPLVMAAEQALASESLDPAARQVIQHAADTGAMNYEDYKQGLDIYIECMANVGVEVRMYEATDFGIPAIRMAERYMPEVFSDDAEYFSVRMNCANTSYFPIETVYQSQPSVIDAKAERINRYLPALSECLAEFGVSMPESVTFDEIMQTIAQVLNESGVACDRETGFRETTSVPTDIWD